MQTIKISEVKRALDVLCDHITNELGLSELPLPHDYYWNIPLDLVYRVDVAREEVAKSLDIGSLAEDLRTVEDVIKNAESRVAVQLSQLSAIVRYLGQAAEEERLRK